MVDSESVLDWLTCTAMAKPRAAHSTPASTCAGVARGRSVRASRRQGPVSGPVKVAGAAGGVGVLGSGDPPGSTSVMP
jgi:hypothetical protein